MKMRFNKRGLSDVITTVLIILLVLAAVAIIAAVVFPALQNAGEKITAECLELKIEPVYCDYGGTYTLNVTYKWEAGDVSLSAVKVIIEEEDGNSEVFDSAKPINILSTLTNRTITTTEKPVKLTIAGVLKTESGKFITCQESLKKVDCVAA